VCGEGEGRCVGGFLGARAVGFGDLGARKGVWEGEESRGSQEIGGRREVLTAEGHGDATAACGGSVAAEVWDARCGVELQRCRTLMIT
jgi:hypothetical protein